MFQGIQDPYKGVTIDSADFTTDITAQNFNQRLQEVHNYETIKILKIVSG